MKEIEQTLQDFGLNPNETQVYLTLLQLGPSSASQISAKSQIHRINIYDILSRLQEKSLVGHIIKGKTKYYQTTSPETILQIEETRKQKIKEIIPQLKQLQRIETTKQNAIIYNGNESVRNAVDKLFDSKTKQVRLFGSDLGLKVFMPKYFETFQLKVQTSNIRIKTLLSKKFRDAKFPRQYKIKYLPEEFIFPSSTMIYEDKVLLVMWSTQPLAIEITGKEISHSYKNYFDILWKNAIS